MKSEDDNTSDATIIHASFDGEKDVETIEGMQPTLYHVNRETNEIGDIHLNSAFVCEETQPTPEDDVRPLQKVERVQLQVMIVQVRNPEHQSVEKKSNWEQLLNRYYIKGEYIY